MKAPRTRASIERRLLVNYRVDPDALAAVLPEPFRPALVDGHGLGGICLIRLGDIRPVGFPAAVGLTSENAAHRIAVRWDTPDGPTTGVYVRRRDTSSRFATLVGGRLFPGRHHTAQFRVQENGDQYRIEVASRDGKVAIALTAHVADRVTPGSLFRTVEEASDFFRCAPIGYSATPAEGVFDRVELETDGWHIDPVHIDDVASSFFDDHRRFPAGTATLDSAFLMGGISTIWHPRPQLRVTPVSDGRSAILGR